MQKKRNIILIIAIVILIIPIYLYSKTLDNNKVLENNYNEKSDNKTLSLMYETNAGSGEYVVSNDTAWSSEGYIFNETKSKCENGGKLTWNEDTETVLLKNNISDRCYVYFDKKATIASTCQGQNIASCIATNYTLDNFIIYHNGTMKDGTYGVIDAEDNSYRYSGASEKVNNFVCFGSEEENCPNDNLYRIIGVFNNQVKLIKYDYAFINLLGIDGEYKSGYKESGYEYYYKGTADISTLPGYYFNNVNGASSTNDWTKSKLNIVNLNTNYINNIGKSWSDKIVETTWKIGGMSWIRGSESSNIAKEAYTYELGESSIDKTYQAKIGLMYMSDYYYAASPTYWTYYGWNLDAAKDYRVATESNWMYMGLAEWTISPRTDDSTLEFDVDYYGSGDYGAVYMYGFGVRPSFYLTPSTVLSGGSGSKTDPYRLS